MLRVCSPVRKAGKRPEEGGSVRRAEVGEQPLDGGLVRPCVWERGFVRRTPWSAGGTANGRRGGRRGRRRWLSELCELSELAELAELGGLRCPRRSGDKGQRQGEACELQGFGGERTDSEVWRNEVDMTRVRSVGIGCSALGRLGAVHLVLSRALPYALSASHRPSSQ